MSSSRSFQERPSISAPSLLLSDDATIVVDLPSSERSETSTIVADAEPRTSKKDARFWLIMMSVLVSTFLSALDFTSVSVALPTIMEDLKDTDHFVWIGSAYSLASTAILPLVGNVASIFGRRSSMLSYLLLFAVGSVITGSAPNMSAMIAGRTVQGLGGGGILAMTEIIVADLVPLSERGTFLGIVGAVWSLASAAGPLVGGGLAQAGAWRWLFYLNLPLCGIAFVLVLAFLRLKQPEGSLWSKLRRVDWCGNALVMTSTTLTIVALVEGGIQYPWKSYQILVPLILGLIGILAFLFYEAHFVEEPSVPYELLNNRTSLSGYAGAFFHGILIAMVVFYLPVYFQGTMLSSPVRSSVQMFPVIFTVAPFTILCGISVARTGHYVVQNILGWIAVTIAAGLFSTLKFDSPQATWIGFQILMGVGTGILFAASQFAILAPLPVEKNANALAFFSFLRTFASTFGVTIGSTVLQNELVQKLPADASTLFSNAQQMTYAAIPEIVLLPQPLQEEVRSAFASSLSILWLVLVGVCAAGFVSSLFMKQLKLHEATDQSWGIEERPPLKATESDDVEKASRV